MLRFYLAMARVGVIGQFQYRVAAYFYMIGMVTEPIIYLVVWSSIARHSPGGAVDGYTPATFAAYYIVWTLVRNINIVFTPFGWEERIREGTLSAHLLQPLHPIHRDLAEFAGTKVTTVVLWIPIAVGLSIAFHPALHPSPLQVVVFLIAIWGAYLIRSLALWVLGMVTFWTTRVGALFEAYFLAELMLSGRLVPMALMPHWVQSLSWALPFRWTFGFPITALVGPVSNRDLGIGLAMQAMWIAVWAVVVTVVWRRGVRRFTAVGA